MQQRTNDKGEYQEGKCLSRIVFPGYLEFGEEEVE